MFRPTALLCLILVVAAALAGFWSLNKVDKRIVSIDGKINGVAFSPYQRNQDPQKDIHPSLQDIDRDLAAVAPLAEKVRTYSALDGLDKIPELAVKYNLKVVAGAWVDNRAQRSEREVANLIRMVRNNPGTVERVLVGNESILRGDLRVPQLVSYIRQVKRNVNVPVSTAEPWHVWAENTELVQAVDFIAIHVLPYWEGMSVEASLKFFMDRYNELRIAYPTKRIIVTEIGWPSDGRLRRDAVASRANQAKFLREFFALARANNIEYFVMEAVDQPWKHGIEGKAGAYWGMLDAERQPKWSMTGPIETLPQWRLIAGASIALAIVPLLLFFHRWRNLSFAGELFFAALIQGCAALVAWTLFAGFSTYQSMGMAIAWSLLFLCLAGTLLLVLMQALEMTEVVWMKAWRRVFLPAKPETRAHWPKVSLHLPICNEPPHMVKISLDALAWDPLESTCRHASLSIL